MKLILLGAPGAGKGTQAAVIRDRLSAPVISTGNMIREAVSAGTPLGKQAEIIIGAGELVPDEIVIELVKERLSREDCKEGFILDGFPRTIPQAEALEEIDAGIDIALSLDVSDEAIISRMSGRRVCPKCGASYHLEYIKPREEGLCDKCGGTLVCRTDDLPETVRERLRVYHEQTEPLLDFYRSRGMLRVAEGQEDVEDTTRNVLEVLGFES